MALEVAVDKKMSVIEAAGVRVTTLGMAPDASLAELVRGAFRLARMLDERKIDLAQTFLRV